MTSATTKPTGGDTRPLWGIAQYDDGTRRVPWPVSHAEIERAMGGAVPTLAGLEFVRGTRVLWCSLLSEAAHFWPLIIGTMLSGAQFSLADATASDALRAGMFLRRLEYRAVMGVNEAVLDGFDQLGCAYSEAFGAVPVIGARPGAYERLVSAGLAPYWFVLCGPAVAIGVEAGGEALVDPAEWALSEVDGRIHVTSTQPRALTFDCTPTAIRGSLVDEHTFAPQTGEPE
jgi:hypothetical protein